MGHLVNAFEQVGKVYMATNAPEDNNISLAVIATKLDLMNAEMRHGFDRIDSRLEKLDQRVGQLELWRAQETARREAEDRELQRLERIEDKDDSGPDLIKIALAALSLAGAVVGFFAGGGSVH